jgi:hypothetical protein
MNFDRDFELSIFFESSFKFSFWLKPVIVIRRLRSLK